MSTGTTPAPSRTSIPTSTRAVAGCALVLMLIVGLFAAAPPVAADPQHTLRVELTDLSPAVLRPGDDLVIRGTVYNDSTEPVVAPAVELIMQRQALSSRVSVDQWHQGTTSSRIGTATPLSEELEEDLPPRSATPFTLTMPAAPTFAETSPWGPRGIEVSITGTGAAGTARSLLLWFPETSPLATPAELSVLMPLTPTSAEWAEAADRGVPVATTASARLRPLLQSTQNHPVSWALDPALLEAAPLVPPAPLDLLADPAANTPTDDDDTNDDAAADDPDSPAPGTPEQPDGDNGTNGADGTGPTTPDDENGEQSAGTDQETATSDPGDGDGGNGGDSADTDTAPPPVIGQTPGADLVDDLLREAPRRDVLALGYADADITALAHAEDLSLWRLGQQRSTSLLDQWGVSPLSGVLAPAGRLDGTTFDAIAAHGVQTVITTESALAPDPVMGPHHSATHVESGSGPMHAVVSDERISALLTGHHPDGAELDDLTARQLLLAETAAVVREGDHEGSGFLATLPREVSGADLQERLTELDQLPWMDLTNLRGLLGRPPAGEPRAATAADLNDRDRLSPDRIADLEHAHTQVADLAGTLPDPTAALNQMEPLVLAALSNSWVNDTGGREDLLDRVETVAAELNGAVRVEQGSDVLLINHSGDLPVTVANDLPVPARVLIALVPHDPRLRAGEPVQAVLEPETITTVRVPIQAVANGNVELDVHVLSTAEQRAIGQGASFMVRVRADWEDIGTAVVAALLAVGFVVGLVRTIRSGRRRFPPPSSAHGPAHAKGRAR